MIFVPGSFLPEYRPVRKLSPLSSSGWWLNRWPLLGWLETFLKVFAWLFVSFISPSSSSSTSSIPICKMSTNFLIESFLMLIASSLLALAVVDRVVYRELISMVFVFPNNWAHWSVTTSMLRHGRVGLNVRYFRCFVCLMFIGDIVKLVFFAVHDFSRLHVARFVLYALVALFAALYATLLLLDYGYVAVPADSASVRNVVLPALLAFERAFLPARPQGTSDFTSTAGQ